MMTAAPARVVEAYGSIKAFEELHQPGELMFPIEAIRSDPPNVWLTSFYGFGPEEWGLLGFTDRKMRTSFVNRSQPGVLVVVYGGREAPEAEQDKILGILQCSHRIGMAEQFMSPVAWERKEQNSRDAKSWNFAVKATRAWRVAPETWMDVATFAPETYSAARARAVGAWGMQLKRTEAERILKLDLQEVDVYGETPIEVRAPNSALEVLAPSKAGPVSQCPFIVTEAEGPKHLYILKLQGDTDTFLGDASDGRPILKAGFSKNPQTRCDDHNRTLPGRCAFHWEVLFSGMLSGYDPYPSSEHAKTGERAMQRVLGRWPAGCSLGGEFFLATDSLIEEAWSAGNLAAKEYRK